MSFPIYLHKDLIQVPLPITGLHTPCPAFFDLVFKLRAELVPPLPYGFIAYVHATFMKMVFHIPQREWKPYIQHNYKLDDLRTSFKIAKGYRIGHSWVANYQGSPKQEGLF